MTQGVVRRGRFLARLSEVSRLSVKLVLQRAFLLAVPANEYSGVLSFILDFFTFSISLKLVAMQESQLSDGHNVTWLAWAIHFQVVGSRWGPKRLISHAKSIGKVLPRP